MEGGFEVKGNDGHGDEVESEAEMEEVSELL